MITIAITVIWLREFSGQFYQFWIQLTNLVLVILREVVYNIYILNFWSVYNWHFYITTFEIGEKYCAINDALIFNGMFSALCVLTIITLILCVYTHGQAMVKTACPGGVNTLLYLKHQISLITFYTQQVALPCTTCLSVVFENRVNN